MKKTCMKLLVCMLIALCAVSTVSMAIPVKAASIAPYSYYEQNFSFKGGCTISRDCSGMFMNVTVRATASNNNNETITLEVYVENRKASKYYTFYSDGQNHTFKNIYLGLSGGSSVAYIFTGANPEITINVYMEIES